MHELRVDIVDRPVEVLDWLSKNFKHVSITEETTRDSSKKVSRLRVEQMKAHFEEIDRSMPGAQGRMNFTVKFKNDDDFAFFKLRFAS